MSKFITTIGLATIGSLCLGINQIDKDEQELEKTIQVLEQKEAEHRKQLELIEQQRARLKNAREENRKKSEIKELNRIEQELAQKKQALSELEEKKHENSVPGVKDNRPERTDWQWYNPGSWNTWSADDYLEDAIRNDDISKAKKALEGTLEEVSGRADVNKVQPVLLLIGKIIGRGEKSRMPSEKWVTLFLQNDAQVQVNKKNFRDETPLLSVASQKTYYIRTRSKFNENEKNRIAIASILLKHGADVNVSHEGGWTPLVYALFFGYYNFAEFLVKNGANINVKFKSEYDNEDTLFKLAAREIASSDDETLLNFLEEHGARIDKKNLEKKNNVLQSK